MVRHRVWALWLVVTACVAPSPATEQAFCSSSADCSSKPNCTADPAAGVDCKLHCIADVTLGLSYCTSGCETDADCGAHQRCSEGVADDSKKVAVRFCVDRVRECLETELCNGLDDDCDGVVDGPQCEVVTGCLDDAGCGAFVCSAPPNHPVALCQPANPSATAAEFETCTDGAQCATGLCETGICSPLCRPQLADDTDCPVGFFCGTAVGHPASPAHNVCQKACRIGRDCNAGQMCVWRGVYQGGDSHEFVCAVPGPDRWPTGAGCAANDGPGDDSCEQGLCYDFHCTRPCAGPGAYCGDVAPGKACNGEQLIYGGREFLRSVCSNPREWRACASVDDCTLDEVCVWSAVARRRGLPLGHREFICALPSVERRVLGNPCDDDDQCDRGLCVQGLCTRPCPDATDPCGDVAGTTCQATTVRYGADLTFNVQVCAP